MWRDSSLPGIQRLAQKLRRAGDSLLLGEVQIAHPALADFEAPPHGFRYGERGTEDGVGDGERNPATEGEGVELGEDEARVGVGREAGLDRFQVEEFCGMCGGGRGGRLLEEEGGGDAGGDEGFAEGSVGRPD
ncbi:hypothetical protein F2Q70_00005354 [Brassica cretica]|uniref:Uncharacterized protein n=1 Tax=Brassica cretica TaxID=69181 RepID=A0A8S9IMQ0_BRACR|nr:hypothetical protein F2Q70_00005354 [Brassica cretica]